MNETFSDDIIFAFYSQVGEKTKIKIKHSLKWDSNNKTVENKTTKYQSFRWQNLRFQTRYQILKKDNTQKISRLYNFAFLKHF